MYTREAADSGRVKAAAEQAIKALLTDRPIAYHPVLARAVGSVTAGVFLAQLLYWTPRSQDPTGRIWKTQDEIFDETALTRSEQETARRILKTAGVVEEKRAGVPARMYFRVDMARLTELLGELPDEQGKRRRRPAPNGGGEGRVLAADKNAGIPQTSLQDSRKLERSDPADKDAQTPQAITETTSEITTEIVVVGALRDRGISDAVAQDLGRCFPADYILAKCDVIDWLVETKSRLVGKNAAGYLRRAIEEDYAPPPRYKSRSEREAEAAALAAAIAAQEAERRELAAEEGRLHEVDLTAVHGRYPPQPIAGTDLTTEAAWVLALATLEETLSRPNFEAFLKHTHLLHVDGDQVTIGGRSTFEVEQLTSRLDRYITPALSGVLDRPVRCTYVSLAKLLAEPEEGSDQAAHRPTRRDAAQAAVSTGGQR